MPTSVFPILVKVLNNNSFVICDTAKDIPHGVSVRVIETKLNRRDMDEVVTKYMVGK